MNSTLCYIKNEKDEYLLLHRTVKENDLNEGKWIGVGGKFEEGESADECVIREVYEETGLTLEHFHLHGVVKFVSDTWEDEDMYLYSADGYTGTLRSDCDEGELAWIPEDKVLSLPTWEGDRYFLEPLLAGREHINMLVQYEGEKLVRHLDLDDQRSSDPGSPAKLDLVVASSMMAAMTALATMIIRIPTPGTNGYVNIGDSVVLLSAWILGNPYGAVSAALGSALADVLSGYPVYSPGTAVIKFLMGFAAAFVLKTASGKNFPGIAVRMTGAVISELIMIIGYFLYESTILGYGTAAAASVVSNVVQGVVCLVLANLLIIPLMRISYIRKIKKTY